jgi:hypothetical protein
MFPRVGGADVALVPVIRWETISSIHSNSLENYRCAQLECIYWRSRIIKTAFMMKRQQTYLMQHHICLVDLTRPDVIGGERGMLEERWTEGNRTHWSKLRVDNCSYPVPKHHKRSLPP